MLPHLTSATFFLLAAFFPSLWPLVLQGSLGGQVVVLDKYWNYNVNIFLIYYKTGGRGKQVVPHSIYYSVPTLSYNMIPSNPGLSLDTNLYQGLANFYLHWLMFLQYFPPSLKLAKLGLPLLYISYIHSYYLAPDCPLPNPTMSDYRLSIPLWLWL